MDNFIELILPFIIFLDTLLISPFLTRFYSESIFFLPSLFFAVFFIYFKKRSFSIKRFYCAFLSKKIWNTQSTQIDLMSLVSNIVLLGLFGMALKIMISGDAYVLSYDFSQWLKSSIDIDFKIENPILASLIATFFSFIVLDFYFYWFHRAFHSNKFLWKIHSRHHSATNLTPITNFRGHPLEIALKLPLSFVASIIIGGVSEYISDGRSQEIVILGTNMFAFFVLFFGGSLVHSHIFLCFPTWLSRIIVSPAMHQVHHSALPHHYNKNYGSSLSIWDYIFNSIYIPKQNEKVKFGLSLKKNQQDSIYVFIFGENICALFKSITTQKEEKT